MTERKEERLGDRDIIPAFFFLFLWDTNFYDMIIECKNIDRIREKHYGRIF